MLGFPAVYKNVIVKEYINGQVGHFMALVFDIVMVYEN